MRKIDWFVGYELCFYSTGLEIKNLPSGQKKLALDNIEWSQIGHLMNFLQRIISIMERDWNVEWD